MNTTVTVKNKLGNTFGNRQIQVNTQPNEENTGSVTISPGGENMVHPLELQATEPQELDAIEIEALGEGNEIPIPISIDTTGDLTVEVDCLTGEDKWILTFTSSIVWGQTKNGDSNVNVTLGQDDSPNIMFYLVVALVIGFLIGLLFCL